MSNLNRNHLHKYKFKQLLNGYRQLDPTRGVSYILDLILTDSEQKQEVTKRVNLMRPLGDIQITYMNNNYTRKGPPLNIIVSFSTNNNYSHILNFIINLKYSVLNKMPKKPIFKLHVAYTTANLTLPDRKYDFLQLKFKELVEQFPKIRLNIRKIRIRNRKLYFSEEYRQHLVIEQFSRNISKYGLILMVPSCAYLTPEFLERVSMHTIQTKQVFFPIAFDEYNPKILKMFNLTTNKISIDREKGHFNQHVYEFASFYNYDYLTVARLSNNGRNGKRILNLFELFQVYSDMELIRAPDKDLKCEWRLVENCEKRKLSFEENERCFKQRESSVGSSPQLFRILVDQAPK